MEIKELGMFHMLDAIEAWQNDHGLHELTCGQDTCDHINLIGKIRPTSNVIIASGQQGSKIVLQCPKCDHTQEHVPEFVYKWYIDNHMNHKIPLGQVVELEITDGFGAEAIYRSKSYTYPDGLTVQPEEGVEAPDEVSEIDLRFVGNLKALVVGHTRDCDGTPLYCLGFKRIQYPTDELPEGYTRMTETMLYNKWCGSIHSGISEDSLKVIEGQFVSLEYKSIFEYQKDLL